MHILKQFKSSSVTGNIAEYAKIKHFSIVYGDQIGSMSNHEDDGSVKIT